ncbi:MAG TPA: CDF family Co(II)/Ni(II) efflux transporter DmeF [Methylocella sp.]|nr:CDF family Co(II)/Ni(II) efflux transporter DmeF [Methylocella sp.]
MDNQNAGAPSGDHSHIFLGASHAANERRTWAAIALTMVMMVAEIAGGTLYGSLAVVADGFHMATHALALLIAALAYTFARRHAYDSRFVFGTGKFGDLAGYTSAIILAMIALIIGYEAAARLFLPVTIHFDEAILIAAAGLIVNVLTAWLLGGDHHGHAHGAGDHAGPEAHAHDEPRRIDTGVGRFLLEVFEDGVPPRFRLRSADSLEVMPVLSGRIFTIETERPDGARQIFHFTDRGTFLESIEEIPEPHAFKARLRFAGLDNEEVYELDFAEHAHAGGAAERDNNMRAAFVHVAADAGVSVLAICGLLLGRFFGWFFMDPVMGIMGALVIANWAYGLMRDTSGMLLDMNPDKDVTEELRRAIESGGDRLADLHVWRLGPGHLGAIISVLTDASRDAEFYRSKLSRFHMLSHVTIEVRRATLQPQPLRARSFRSLFNYFAISLGKLNKTGAPLALRCDYHGPKASPLSNEGMKAGERLFARSD